MSGAWPGELELAKEIIEHRSADVRPDVGFIGRAWPAILAMAGERCILGVFLPERALVALAACLRRRGLTEPEIARAIGVSRADVAGWLGELDALAAQGAEALALHASLIVALDAA